MLDFQKSLPIGIMVVNHNGKIVDYNPKLRSLLGFSPADVKSMSSLKARWTDNGIKLSTGDWAMMRSLKYGEAVEGDSIDITSKGGEKATLCISYAQLEILKPNQLLDRFQYFKTSLTKESQKWMLWKENIRLKIV